MGARSRNKGARGECDAAKLLLGCLADAGIDADIHRNADQTRSGGFDLVGFRGSRWK